MAALAVGGRVGLPTRLVTIIEGEGLLNDATALTILTVAVTAATSGGFSLGDAVLHFLLAAAGGMLAGVAVAFAVRALRSAVRDPLLVNCISLATPFGAYLLGEELHVSGVLAVAVAVLMIGHDTPRFTTGASRLQASAVWHLVDFLLQGFVFLLIGEQILPVVRGLKAYPASTIVTAVLLTLGVVLLLRPLWLVLTEWLPGALRIRRGGSDPRRRHRLSGREIVVLSWAGIRGVISLAAIFTVPLTTSSGKPFPGRDLLLFCTFVVVVVTLVGQGVTFAPVVRALGVLGDPADEAALRNEASAASVQAGLACLNQLADGSGLPEQELAGLRASLDRRLRRYQLIESPASSGPSGSSGDTGETPPPSTPDHEAALETRRAVIDVQREELLRWRDAGRLPDASLRALERELDHEERMFPGPDGH